MKMKKRSIYREGDKIRGRDMREKTKMNTIPLCNFIVKEVHDTGAPNGQYRIVTESSKAYENGYISISWTLMFARTKGRKTRMVYESGFMITDQQQVYIPNNVEQYVPRKAERFEKKGLTLADYLEV